jgi:hypothetical protein
MLPALEALDVSADGIVTVVGVAAGSVPAGTPVLGGIAVKSDGKLYVVYV